MLHLSRHVPPQSTPDSVPFMTSSLQVGAAHSLLRTHTADAISRSDTRRSPAPQGGHEPPQSRSVSSPSLFHFDRTARGGPVHVGLHTDEAGAVGTFDAGFATIAAATRETTAVNVGLPFI